MQAASQMQRLAGGALVAAGDPYQVVEGQVGGGVAQDALLDEEHVAAAGLDLLHQA